MGFPGNSGNIFKLLPETVNLSAGQTVLISALPGQIGVTVKYVSGGTLSFISATLTINAQAYGVSLAASQKYIIGTSEIFNFDGSGSFTLLAEGVTTVFSMIRGLAGDYP